MLSSIALSTLITILAGAVAGPGPMLSERRLAMQVAVEPIVSKASAPARTDTASDEATISALDLNFQRAVKANDAPTMDRILHDDYWLVLGDGTVVTRSELIDEAKSGAIQYEVQDEVSGTQTVRVWGDTGVVTAKLKIKGWRGGKLFSRTLWFSDTYVRTPEGWKYAFAQASLPLPDE